NNAYYYKAVLWAVENGITSGTTSTTFSPDDSVTRSQAVTFMWRAAGKPVSNCINPFTDVSGDDYYYDAIMWAVEKDITQGSGTSTFSPNNFCTRGQIVTFLYRAKL
ncbi:MAG: S-layer homology domain-containing protein, partial [Candidatus Metalachnospira sp.]|nr:S-layer homology domain-containing protein [Candidatus Metalachnospira sp.]